MADKPENFTLAEGIKKRAREPDWIFPELWEARTAGMIAGDSGLGKTHFVMQILQAISQVTDFTERTHPISTKGPT